MIVDKDRAFKKAKRKDTQEAWATSRRLRNITNISCTRARTQYTSDSLEFNKNDSRKFWRAIKDVIPENYNGDGKIHLVDQSDKTPIEEKDTTNFINNYFTTVGPNLAKKFNNQWTNFGDVADTTIMDFVISKEEVLKLIKDIDIAKSSAIDHLSSRVLKDAFVVVFWQINVNR